MRMSDLEPGSAIVGNDGGRIATVRAVGQEYIVASPARGRTPLHIPASAVANVQDGVVFLNIASRDAQAMGWEQPPRTDDTPDVPGSSDLHRHV
jgi:hypothetical protein